MWEAVQLVAFGVALYFSIRAIRREAALLSGEDGEQ